MLEMGASSGSWPDPVFRHAESLPAPLGIGLRMTPASRAVAERSLDGLDFIAIDPADFWPDCDPVSVERSTSIHAATRLLDVIAGDRPLVAMGLGAAFAEGRPLDARGLARLLEWQARYRFVWIGAPLLPESTATPGPVAVAMRESSVPRRELRRIVGRIREARAALPMPLLLRNGVWPLGPASPDMTEAALLNRMCTVTGCDVVLDLQALVVNALSWGVDALAYLDRLDLERVIEVRVGLEPRRVVPEIPVPAVRQPPTILELLDAVLWRTPRLRAVTVDIRDADLPDVGVAEAAGLLASVRRIWNIFH